MESNDPVAARGEARCAARRPTARHGLAEDVRGRQRRAIARSCDPRRLVNPIACSSIPTTIAITDVITTLGAMAHLVLGTSTTHPGDGIPATTDTRTAATDTAADGTASTPDR